jgi:cytochrome c553
MRPSFLRIVMPLALMGMASAPDGPSIAHNGDGHGAPACVICHGQNFQGSPAIRAPALAGLPQATILDRLAHYAGPQGHNAMMRQVATALTQPERQAVAAYLSSLPPAH